MCDSYIIVVTNFNEIFAKANLKIKYIKTHEL